MKIPTIHMRNLHIYGKSIYIYTIEILLPVDALLFNAGCNFS